MKIQDNSEIHAQWSMLVFIGSKVREMQNSSEAFKSNFDLYQRVAHKKLFKRNVLLDFPISRFPSGGPFYNMVFFS